MQAGDKLAQSDLEVVAPLGGTRAEAVQRLQIGLSGVAAMILLVGLANVIQNRARETEQLSVPEAAPTTEPLATPQQRDPLVEAGIVPDMPVESPSPAQPEGNRQPQQGAPRDGNNDANQKR